MSLLLLWRMAARGVLLYWLGALSVGYYKSNGPAWLALKISNLRLAIARDLDEIRARSKAYPSSRNDQ